jgi:hypothetical protein
MGIGMGRVMTGFIEKEMLVAALCERRCAGDAMRRFIRSTVLDAPLHSFRWHVNFADYSEPV